jgi:hypothetical protein
MVFSNRYMLMKYNPPCGSVKSLHVYILFYSQAIVLLKPVVPTAQYLEQDVINYDYKPEIARASRVTSFATAGLGLNLTIEAWPTLTQTSLSDALHV